MNARRDRIRVVKVGGSLFANPWLPQRLQRWLEQGRDCRHVLVAGGGQLVDRVRQWHRTFDLSEEFSHAASVRLMSESARLLAEILSDIPVVDSLQKAVAPEAGPNVILDCRNFMETETKLEHSWATTSDSIAAEIAATLPADELWLLKSTLPESANRRAWQNAGIVDQNFCEAAKSVPSVFVANLDTADLLSIQGN